MNTQKISSHPKFAVFVDASGTILQSSFSNITGVHLYPDAKNLLVAMKKRDINGVPIKTGLITNWGDRVNSILKSLNVHDYFDVIVNADIVPKAKPSKEIFHFACNEVGIEFHNAFHIGDSFSDDAIGAQEAGLNGIWLKRAASIYHDCSQLKLPYFESLDEVLDYLSEKLKENG